MRYVLKDEVARGYNTSDLMFEAVDDGSLRAVTLTRPNAYRFVSDWIDVGRPLVDVSNDSRVLSLLDAENNVVKKYRFPTPRCVMLMREEGLTQEQAEDWICLEKKRVRVVKPRKAEWGKKIRVARGVLEGGVLGSHGLSASRESQLVTSVLRRCGEILRRNSQGFNFSELEQNRATGSIREYRKHAASWLQLINILESEIEA